MTRTSMMGTRMGNTLVALKDKIMEMYPEIEKQSILAKTSSLGLKVRFAKLDLPPSLVVYPEKQQRDFRSTSQPIKPKSPFRGNGHIAAAQAIAEVRSEKT